MSKEGQTYLETYLWKNHSIVDFYMSKLCIASKPLHITSNPLYIASETLYYHINAILPKKLCLLPQSNQSVLSCYLATIYCCVTNVSVSLESFCVLRVCLCVIPRVCTGNIVDCWFKVDSSGVMICLVRYQWWLVCVKSWQVSLCSRFTYMYNEIVVLIYLVNWFYLY